MAQIKFYRGLKEKYNQLTHADGLYFTTDTLEIILNNKSYGFDVKTSDVVVGAKWTSPDTITLTTGKGEEITIKIPTASDSVTGLLSNTDKKKYDDFVASKGMANGLATLNENGKVPASQLDGTLGRVQGIEKFLDTEAELSSDPDASTAEEGEKYFCKDVSKIFTKTSDGWDEGIAPVGDTIYNHRLADKLGRTNILYRWDGSTMVEISASIALGETEGTAYEGSKGKALKDSFDAHAANQSNPHNVTKEQVGLGNVENLAPADLPVSTATQTALDKKVDKVEGSSLVEDTEIAKLKGLSEQSVIDAAIADAKKAGTDADNHLKAITGQTPGIYVPNEESEYISGATSLNDADKLLAAQIKKNADDIAALSGGEGSVSTQIEAAISALKGTATENYDTLGEIETAIKNNDVKSLSFDQNTRTLTLTKGNDSIVTVVLPEATASLAGLMSSTDKAALDKAVSDITTINQTITANKVVAADKSIEVTEGENTSIKVKLKADANALKLGADGLYVDEAALAAYTGSEAIKVSDKAISLTIKAEDKVLSQSDDGLLANINLTWSTSEGLKLIGKDGAVIATIPATDFVKDGMLKNVELVELSEGEDTNSEGLADGTYLKFTFNSDAGDKVIYVNVTSLIDIYTAGNGIELSGKAISIKIDTSGETKYLTVGASGLKLSGIDSAISTAVSEAKTTIDAYTVNGKAINTNPTLSGADIALTGYNVPGGTVTASDNINQAIGKLDEALIWHEAN